MKIKTVSLEQRKEFGKNMSKTVKLTAEITEDKETVEEALKILQTKINEFLYPKNNEKTTNFFKSLKKEGK